MSDSKFMKENVPSKIHGDVRRATKPHAHVIYRILPVVIFMVSLLALGCRSSSDSHTKKAPKGTSAHVTGILTEMDSCVVRVCKAADKNELSKMADVFDQINECCDELQGKNRNPAPTAGEWGDLTADQHREILDLIAGIEKDAEGLRSITLDRDLEQSKREAALKKVWNSLFMEKYRKLTALLEGDD